MGLDTETVKKPLRNCRHVVERSPAGVERGLLQIAEEREEQGLSSEILLQGLRSAPAVARKDEPLYQHAVAVAASPVATAVAAVPAVTILKRPVCFGCGETMRSGSTTLECAGEECGAVRHQHCGKTGAKCRSCSGNPLKRDRQESVKKKEDFSLIVDENLEKIGAVATQKKERAQWLRPTKELPETLVETEDRGVGLDEQLKRRNEMLSNDAPEMLSETLQVTVMIDASAQFYRNVAQAGAGLFGSKSASKSAAFVVRQTSELVEILSTIMDVKVELCAAACEGNEHATLKARHHGDGQRALRRIERAAAAQQEGPSRKRNHQVVESVMRNLSDLSFVPKQTIRRQFVSDVAAAMGADQHFHLVRVCDEDRYFLVDSHLLHVIDSVDYDALWMGLRCVDDRQVVIVMNSESKSISLTDARVAKANAMAELFPDLNSLLAPEQFVFWSRSFIGSTLLERTVWLASVLACAWRDVCDFADGIVVKNNKNENRTIYFKTWMDWWARYFKNRCIQNGRVMCSASLDDFISWLAKQKKRGLMEDVACKTSVQQAVRRLLSKVGVKVLMYRADLTIETAGVNQWLDFCGTSEEKEVGSWIDELATATKVRVETPFAVDSKSLIEDFIAFQRERDNRKRKSREVRKGEENNKWEKPRRFVRSAKARNGKISLAELSRQMTNDSNAFNTLQRAQKLSKAPDNRDVESVDSSVLLDQEDVEMEEAVEEAVETVDGSTVPVDEKDQRAVELTRPKKMASKTTKSRRPRKKNAKPLAKSAHVRSFGSGKVSGNVASGKMEGKSMVTRQCGSVEYFVGKDVFRPIENFLDKLNRFLETFAFPFAIFCGVDGGAPFAAWHYSIWRNLHVFILRGTLAEDLSIQQLDAKLRFAGDSNSVFPVDIPGNQDEFKKLLREFISRLPENWASEMDLVLSELAKSENWTLVSNLAITVANCFGNLIPEQLQRFGTALIDEACAAAHGHDEWHGFSVARIEELTGLADLSAGGDTTSPKAIREEKNVSKKVEDAAELFSCHVREVFAIVGAVERTADGGVSPKAIQLFLNSAKHRFELYGKALLAVKELQRLWRRYFPSSNGVLVWPRKRGRWMVRIANSNLTCFRQKVDGEDRFETWCEWFERNSKRADGKKPGFERFVMDEKTGIRKGGIISDGFSVSVYGERHTADLQRTPLRTATHLKEKGVPEQVKQYLRHAVVEEKAEQDEFR